MTKSKEFLTRERSENIDLAEKGIRSPLNPNPRGLKVDPKDEETVLNSAVPTGNKKTSKRKIKDSE